MLTGAAYKIFLRIYDELKPELGAEEAVRLAGEIMGVFQVRANDYTPENQMTLEDVGKAYLKVDKEFFGSRYHAALVDEFMPHPTDLGGANEQVFVALFGTGLRNRSNLLAVSAKIGGAEAYVQFAGSTYELAGLDQVNVQLPRNLTWRSGRGADGGRQDREHGQNQHQVEQTDCLPKHREKEIKMKTMPGYYNWRVYAYSGSTSYDLQPRGTRGTRGNSGSARWLPRAPVFW